MSAPLGCWLATVACPHCGATHRVWSDRASPAQEPLRCVFECPTAGARVVFPAARPWGEVVGAPPPGACPASPFHL